MTRNIGTSAQLPTLRGMSHAAPCGQDVSQKYADRDTSARHSRYAAEVWPQLQHQAKVRWFALFGITYPFKEE